MPWSPLESPCGESPRLTRRSRPSWSRATRTSARARSCAQPRVAVRRSRTTPSRRKGFRSATLTAAHTATRSSTRRGSSTDRWTNGTRWSDRPSRPSPISRTACCFSWTPRKRAATRSPINVDSSTRSGPCSRTCRSSSPQRRATWAGSLVRVRFRYQPSPVRVCRRCWTCSWSLSPAAVLQPRLHRQRLSVHAFHGEADAFRDFRDGRWIVEMSDRIDDGAAAALWILRLENPGSDEDAVTAHEHHQGGIGRRRDPTGREVDHRKALDLLDLGQDLEQPFGDRVEVLVGEDDVGVRDARRLAVCPSDLLEEYRAAGRKLRGVPVKA